MNLTKNATRVAADGQKLNGKTTTKVMYKLVNDAAGLHERNTAITAKEGDDYAVAMVFRRAVRPGDYVVREETTIKLTVASPPPNLPPRI